MWAANSLLYPHFRPLVFSSSFFSSFSSTSNLISVTWSTLASSLRFHFFVLFFFLCVSWLEYPGIYYFRLLSLSPNFTLCSSFLGPYLDPASSTLLALFAYTLFLLRLRSWSCYPRSFAFLRIERSSPLLVFLSLLIFIISPHRSCSLNTVFLCTILALFCSSLTSLSFSIFIISSCPRCFELCLSRNVYIPHYSSLFVLYLDPVLSSLFFSFFEGNDYDFSRLCFLSFLTFIILFVSSLLFKLRFSLILHFIVFFFPHSILLFFFDHLSSWLSLYVLHSNFLYFFTKYLCFNYSDI